MNNLYHTCSNYIKIKHEFFNMLKNKLELNEIYAPIILEDTTKLNDFLNHNDNTNVIKFENNNKTYEIVQSLAKWKRYTLNKMYDGEHCYGICTDMRAIRPKEEVDNIHSLTVDQFDWEKIIDKNNYNIDYLKHIVKIIYSVLYHFIIKYYDDKTYYPNKIAFINYNMLKTERIYEYCIKEYRAACVLKIPDNRAVDYDNWDLNCDIVLWDKEINHSLEISSMGIRVNKESLIKQINIKGYDINDYNSDYHKGILNETYPLTIGGGIGYTRFLMLLHKLDDIHKLF